MSNKSPKHLTANKILDIYYKDSHESQVLNISDSRTGLAKVGFMVLKVFKTYNPGKFKIYGFKVFF